MDKVSIIIPVYNVEKYIRQCLDSVLSQTYYNLEVILIDDNSPDHCPEICDEYAQKDARVIALHQKNGGAANARNHGLDVATGDYICFVDSDDYVTKDYVEKLLSNIQKNKADIAVCSFTNIYKNTTETTDMISRGCYSSEEYLMEFLKNWTCGLIWNKIFSRETIGNIRFSEGHKIDDEFFTYKLVLNSKKIVAYPDELYCYRMRTSGVMLSKDKTRFQMIKDRVEYLTERYDLVTEMVPHLKRAYLANLTDNLIALKNEITSYGFDQTDIKKAYKKYRSKIIMGPISAQLKYSFLLSIFVDRKNSKNEVFKTDKEYFD